MRIHIEGADAPVQGISKLVSAHIGSAVDPLIAAFGYLFSAYFVGEEIRDVDFLFAFLVFLLMHPGQLPFSVRTRYGTAHIIKKWLVVLGAAVLFVLVTRTFTSFDRNVLIVWGLVTPVLMWAIHAAMPSLMPKLRDFFPNQNVVVVGLNEVGKHLAQLIVSGKTGHHQQLVGFFDDREAERLGPLDPALSRPLGKIKDTHDFVKEHDVDVIYVALPMASQPRVTKLLEDLGDTTATVKFVPDIFMAELIQAKVENIAGVPVIAVRDTPLVGMNAVKKRVFDLFGCAVALPFALPLMAIIYCLIRFTSPGPAIFKQRRYGFNGEEICVWKFRSMRVTEDGDKNYKQVTQGDDRVTPIGRILRKTSLDELPQLFNVLTGAMSLVGPRPHAVAVNEAYRQQISGYMLRHKIKPGMTGWAQVHGYRGGDDLESMSKRIKCDLAYLRSWSLSLDFYIVLRTVMMMVRGDPKAY